MTASLDGRSITESLMYVPGNKLTLGLQLLQDSSTMFIIELQKRSKNDQYHLRLQNLLYEVGHLQKEINKCLEFRYVILWLGDGKKWW